jgi:DNA polymerase-3 subunit epsilon
VSLIAVVDVETTGLRPFANDRIVELGAVIVDAEGQVVRELATLVNPDRDVGPSRVHGLTASDLAEAPRFAAVIGPLLDFLNGSVALAGHNVGFDKSFLAAEFQRAGVDLPEVPTLCTMRLSGGGRLSDCCERYGVSFEGRQHSALDDARASARLLRALFRSSSCSGPGMGENKPVSWPRVESEARGLLTRSQAATARLASPTYLQRLMERSDAFPGTSNSAEGVLEYDDLLRRAIVDRHIDKAEGQGLIEIVGAWQLGRPQIEAIHRHRMRDLVRAALKDGVVSVSERRDLLLVGRLLGFDEAAVAALESVESATNACTGAMDSPAPALQSTLNDFVGRTVCFTGESMSRKDGEPVSRERARCLASAAGVQVVSSVTKKLDFLIVADALSESGKARKAREAGIPLVHETVFWSTLGICLD